MSSSTYHMLLFTPAERVHGPHSLKFLCVRVVLFLSVLSTISPTLAMLNLNHHPYKTIYYRSRCLYMHFRVDGMSKVRAICMRKR